MLTKRLSSGYCALSMTDSTTSAGWMRRSIFKKFNKFANPVEATTRNKIAVFLNADVMEYSQWCEGCKNNVSNALSWELKLSDTDLVSFVCLHFPSQVPNHFKIAPLPKKIVSWRTLLLLKLTVKKQLQETYTKTKLEQHDVLSNTCNQLASNMTPSLTDSPATSKTGSCVLLPWLCAKAIFWDQLMTDWLQFEIPCHMYARPSGRTDNQTLPKTATYSLASFYHGYTKLLQTKIQMKSNRKQSLLVSSSSLAVLKFTKTQWAISQLRHLPFCWLCNPANTWKSHRPKGPHWTPPPLKSQIHSRWTNRQPWRPTSTHSRLLSHHHRKSSCHTRCHTVPSQNSGGNCQTHQQLRRHWH